MKPWSLWPLAITSGSSVNHKCPAPLWTAPFLPHSWRFNPHCRLYAVISNGFSNNIGKDWKRCEMFCGETRPHQKGIKASPKHCNLTDGWTFRLDFVLFKFLVFFWGRPLIFPTPICRLPSDVQEQFLALTGEGGVSIREPEQNSQTLRLLEKFGLGSKYCRIWVLYLTQIYQWCTEMGLCV